MRRLAAALLLAAALGGCASKKVCTPSGGVSATPPPPDWRESVTDSDHVKLRALRTVFLAGLNQARAAGFAAQIAPEGPLFDPDAARDGATLPPGDYRCRLFSLGSRLDDLPTYVAAPAYTCRVEPDGQLQKFIQLDGPQRLVGRVYPDEAARTVFLGTRVLADEASPLHYSRDQDRDTVGAIQRIGPERWRMTIPKPAWGATVQVVELVPAP